MKSKKLYLIIVISMILSISINVPVYSIDHNPLNSDVTIEKIEKDEIEEIFNNSKEGIEYNDSREGNVQSLNTDSDSNAVQRKSIQVTINGLNYFKPIYFKPVNDNQYSISLFNKLYEYGEVRLLVVPHRNGDIEYMYDEEVIFDGILNSSQDSIITLNDGNDYLYNIFIVNQDDVVSTHYGYISMENGIPECSIEYISDVETIQTEEKVLGSESRSTIVYTNSIYETESNDTTATADLIASNNDVYGRIGSGTDKDYYKITFGSSGTANFWLGDLYKNCNYDLRVYNSSGSLLWSSTNAGESQELISNKSVSASTYYVMVQSATTTSFNYEYYYFLRVRLLSDTPSGLAWPTTDTYINWCFKCTVYSSPPENLPAHRGLDIRGTNANPVIAMGSGVVAESYNTTKTEHPSYGKAVFINHDFNNPNSIGSTDKEFQTRYAHMIEVLVNKGDVVNRGKILGYIGTTGQSDGEHLHFETLVGTSNVVVDPTKYYAGIQYCNGCKKNLNRINNNETVVNGTYNLKAEVFDDAQDVSGAYFYINNDYILDLEALKQMSVDELEKYGINGEALELMINILIEEGMQEEINLYMNDLEVKSRSL